MALSWNKQADGSYLASTSGFTLTVKQSDTCEWLWHIATPDGNSEGGTEGSLLDAQLEAERSARRHALDLANRMLATLYDHGSLTAQEQQLRTQAMEYIGDSVRWAAYQGNILLGIGPTREEAIEAAVREYESAIGFGDGPNQCATREELESKLILYLMSDDE